jgi:hypothetical protein
MTKLLLRVQKGQVLVQVALMMVVLILFVGLAVDGGNVYSSRRRMQNAADAAALAGAWELCVGNPAIAQATAQDYAEQNGADAVYFPPTANHLISVVVTDTVNTFFMGVIPSLATVDVPAQATAACGEAVSGCYVWPLAFDYNTWNDKIKCNEQFYVFDDNKMPEDVCSVCECEPGVVNGFVGDQSGPGQYGWLRIRDVPTPFPTPPGFKDNCGGDTLGTWIQYGYTGPIKRGDCIPGKSGLTNSQVKTAIVREGQIVHIVIFDNTLPCENTLQGCGEKNALHTVAELGCIRIEQVYVQDNKTDHDTLKLNPIDPKYKGCPEPPSGTVAIRATRLCNCDPTMCVGTDGEPVREGGGVGAVSLIK